MVNSQETRVQEVVAADAPSPDETKERGEPGVWNPELFAQDPERAIAEFLDGAIADVEIQNPILRPDGGTTYLGVALFEGDDDVVTIPFSLELGADGNPVPHSEDAEDVEVNIVDAPMLTVVRKVDDYPMLANMSRNARTNPGHAVKLDRAIDRLAKGISPGDVKRLADTDFSEVRWLGTPNSPRLFFRFGPNKTVVILAETTKNDQKPAIIFLREREMGKK